MKKLIYLIILVSLFACNSDKTQIFDTPQKVIIAGIVHDYNPALKEVEISVNRLGQPQDEIIVPIDSSGNFKTSVETYLPTDIIMRYRARIFAIIHPNDSIFVEINGSANTLADFAKGVQFAGNSKETNQAIAIMNLKYEENESNSYNSRMTAMKELNTDEYLAHIDSVYQENKKLYDEFVVETNPTEEAKLWAKIYVEQAYFDALYLYPGVHRSMNNLKDFEVEASFYEPLTKRLPLDESMLTSGYSMDSYIMCMYNYVYQHTRLSNLNPSPNINLDSLYIYEILKYITDPELRQLVLFRKFYNRIYSNQIDFYEKYKALAEMYIKEPFLKDPLEAIYTKVKKELGAPKILSDSIYTILKSSAVQPIIDTILSKSNGKVIYIDCWAVWCGPCIANFPDSRELHKKLEGKDIEFVYLCLESDSAKWQKLVKEHDLTGQNYLLDDVQSSALRKAFEINGIPHYILIDKKGMIFEKHAAPPGTETEKIEKLINE